MPVDIFTREEFEEALEDRGWKFTLEGIIGGQYRYFIDIDNPYCVINVGSSISPFGVSRECGEDSIRAWLMGSKTPIQFPRVENLVVLGGKYNRWTTRIPGWANRLDDVLTKLKAVGSWIQLCPECGDVLRLSKLENCLLLSCWTKENGKFGNHIVPVRIDQDTGEELASEFGDCPTCGMPLRRVEIKQGKNKGKFALTCPAQENGRYLNHVFKIE